MVADFKKIALFTPWLLLVLTACSPDLRYTDTSHLEKPPVLPKSGRAEAPDEKPEPQEHARVEVREDNLPEQEPPPSPKHRRESKLFALSETKPLHIIFEDSPSQAWDIIILALKRNGIEITDQNRDEGLIYTVFDPDTYSDSENESLLDRLTFSLFKNQFPTAGYVLKLHDRGNQTLITAAEIQPAGDETAEEKKQTIEGEERLVKTIYNTLLDSLHPKKPANTSTEQPAQWNP